MTNEEKMLSMLENVDQRLGRLEENQKSLAKNQKSLEEKFELNKNILLRMEQEHGQKLTALFDGYQSNYDVVTRYEKRVTILERIAEKHHVEIEFLKATNT